MALTCTRYNSDKKLCSQKRRTEKNARVVCVCEDQSLTETMATRSLNLAGGARGGKGSAVASSRLPKPLAVRGRERGKGSAKQGQGRRITTPEALSWNTSTSWQNASPAGEEEEAYEGEVVDSAVSAIDEHWQFDPLGLGERSKFGDWQEYGKYLAFFFLPIFFFFWGVGRDGISFLSCWYSNRLRACVCFGGLVVLRQISTFSRVAESFGESE